MVDSFTAWLTAQYALYHPARCHISQLALNWAIHFNGDFVISIPGATKVRQAQESASAMNFVLSTDELAKLDEVSRKLMK